jgi:hypothetical protein
MNVVIDDGIIANECERIQISFIAIDNYKKMFFKFS